MAGVGFGFSGLHVFGPRYFRVSEFVIPSAAEAALALDCAYGTTEVAPLHTVLL